MKEVKDGFYDLFWIDILIEQPKEGQHCMTRKFGEEGFHSNSRFTNGYFETYERQNNRMIITRWIVDFWKPVGS